MSENPFIKALTDDFALCLPFAGIERISEAISLAEATLDLKPDDIKPAILLHLEQLQVVDYSAFPDVPAHQQEFIRGLQKIEPIRAEEMVFLALRSMVAFSWPVPSSNAHILKAVEFEDAVNRYLIQAALDIGPSVKETAFRLPYWGRLTFLHVLSVFPAESVEKFGLQDLSVALLKAPALNARTFALEKGAVLGLNYALEPILTCLNRYIYHFMHTQHSAGTDRVARAWHGFLPIVLHFWSTVPAFALSNAGCTIFFDDKAPAAAMTETTYQLEFILLHEIAHSLLNHPKITLEYTEPSSAVLALRHEFEFAADAFALSFLKSQTFNALRYTLNPGRKAGNDEASGAPTQPLLRYVDAVDAVDLLFTYMDFIDDAGRMLKARLGGKVRFRDELDSHPAARDRWSRLELSNAGDIPFTRSTSRYAKGLFENVLDYAARLNDDELFAAASRSLVK